MMNRRQFLIIAAIPVSAMATALPVSAHMQEDTATTRLLSIANGIAFREVQATTVDRSAQYWIDDGAVSLSFSWYSVLFPDADIARNTFNDWAGWISDSGNQFSADRPEPFPIGSYEATSYDLVRPETNDTGSLDMLGTWNLENGKPGEVSIGHLALVQTGPMVGIQWTSADRPQKCHITWIGNQAFDTVYSSISANPPQTGDFTTEESLVALLPKPELYLFDPSLVVSVKAVREWTKIQTS